MRGITDDLLQTVAARLRYCQDLSSNETKQVVPVDGKPCYLEKTQVKHEVKQFSALVKPNEEAKQSLVAINCEKLFTVVACLFL